MPMPVSSSKQFLTDEAARALHDAVLIARRRSHTQTTSLHAVSALLSLPSSALRDACSRAGSSAYSQRLQFRALELCVGVSLDRLPTSKSVDEPPISNSLMAAIKRAQANQRRHPETFHLYQQVQPQLQSQSSSLSCVKVEMKHFILSILDDPIVSRVFGDAGFRSPDIKLAILHPPPVSRFSRSRCPPLFLCNLPDLEANQAGINFPFARFSGIENGSEDCKKIGEILAKKKGRSPLLIGVCASDALSRFKKELQSGKSDLLPKGLDGITVISIEKEMSEFVDGNLSMEMMGSKLKEVRERAESCKGCGLVVCYGELKVLVDGKAGEDVPYVVSELSQLVEACAGKFWLIGTAGNYESFMKFSSRFPSIEKDWDLTLLPITSKSLIGGSCSKSSLMGSFVPFGGFFPTASELKQLESMTSQSRNLCGLCNEKYEKEASEFLKGRSTTSIADQYVASLAPWLQTTESDASERINEIKCRPKNMTAY